MSDILARIAAYKREEIAAAKVAVPPREMESRAAAAGPVRPFRAALRRMAEAGRPALVAEIKKASPSRGLIRADFDPPALARAYHEGGAACLSVLTDGPSFGGRPDYLVAARGACDLPVLRKDFLFDTYQVGEARALGADCILVIMAALEDDVARGLIAAAAAFGMDALVEVHDEAELARALALGADFIGVNNRDLRTFATSLSVTERLAALVPEGCTLVAESGIVTPADIDRLRRAGAHAFLVGESLMREADVAGATRRLLDSPASASAAV